MKREELLQDMKFVLATWKRHYPHKLPPMRILRIFESFDEIVTLLKKEVTEKWLAKWIKKMTEYYPADSTMETWLFRKQLIRMLKEAGVVIRK